MKKLNDLKTFKVMFGFALFGIFLMLWPIIDAGFLWQFVSVLIIIGFCFYYIFSYHRLIVEYNKILEAQKEIINIQRKILTGEKHKENGH